MATYESNRYAFTGALVTSLQSPNMADGTVSNTEFQRLDGVTADIQTQLDSKLGASGGTFTGNVTFADGIDLIFGSGSELLIESDGSNGVLVGNSIKFQATDGEDLAKLTANNAVQLFYDSTERLSTTSIGANTSGTHTATTFSGSGASLTSIPAANLTGTYAALNGGSITSLNAANLTGQYAALDGSNINSLNAAALSGVAGSINGTNINNLDAGALATGTVPAARLPGSLGKVLQVVSTNNGTVFQTNSSSYVDVSGQSVTITPSATSSKVLVTLDYTTDTQNDNTVYSVQLVRGSTPIGNAADGNQMLHMNANEYDTGGLTFLDSPSTTSATTYKLQVKTGNHTGPNGGTIVFNRSQDTNTNNFWKSNITVQEIGS